MATKQANTEEDLVLRARNALSNCNWVIGECASEWTERYSRGRTDADFGELIGLSGDQVFQRRRVWETFADVYERYPQIKWSHFHVALNWEDSAECLQWAEENTATVAEMRAWRRAQQGEDLSTPAEDPPFEATGEFLSGEMAMVRDPSEFGSGDGREFSGQYDASDRSPTATAAAREAGPGDEPYAPFGKGARGDAASDKSEKTPPTSEQVIKRMCSTLERVDSSLTPEILEDFHDAPLDIQQRLLDAIENITAKTTGLR